MRETTNKSILLSIFRRNGGEGVLTKIITNENKVNYVNQLEALDKEEPLLCFKEDEQNWILLTNERILKEQVGVRETIAFSELTEVNLALHEEFKDMVMNKKDFTLLALKHRNGSKSVIKLEKGDPFQGMFQVLHYLALKNNN